MAKLARTRQKVFGETGGTSEFGQFGSNQASPPGTKTKDLDQIQALANYDQGWFAATANAGEPPRIEDMNSLFLLATSQLSYLFQAGIPEWLDDADQRYYANASIVQRSGAVYIAILGDDLTNINAQKDPLLEPTWWKVLVPATQETTISATGTFTPLNGINHTLILDTTLGVFTVTLDDWAWNGQKVKLVNADAGTGNAFYKGTGIYDGTSATGTPLSPGYSIEIEGNDTDNRWLYDDVITADWVSGAFDIKQKSLGDMIETENVTLSVVGGTFTGTTSFVVGFANNNILTPNAFLRLSYSLHADPLAHPASFGRTSVVPADYRTSFNYHGKTFLTTTFASGVIIDYRGKF